MFTKTKRAEFHFLFLIFPWVALIASAEANASSEQLWAMHPGGGYVNGKTYNQAVEHCRANSGVLASKGQLLEAQRNGFSMCASGWLNGAVAGYVMVGNHAGCGRDGFNSAGSPNRSKKLGAYCVGSIVPSGVYASVALSSSAQVHGSIESSTVYTTEITKIELDSIDLSNGVPTSSIESPTLGADQTANIEVSGCVEVKGWSCRNSSFGGHVKFRNYCTTQSSLLLGDGEHVKLRNSACLSQRESNASHEDNVSSTYAEFGLVSKFFNESEQRFLEVLKIDPGLIVNLQDDSVREDVRRAGGHLPYSYLQGFVFADIQKAMEKSASQRNAKETAVVEWLLRGTIALKDSNWEAARAEYQAWRKDPCSYSPPEELKNEYFGDPGHTSNCGGHANPLASAFVIGKQLQKTPSVAMFTKWGTYRASKELLKGKTTNLNNTAKTMSVVAVVTAGGIAAAGTAAAFVAASTMTAVVAFNGGTAAGLSIVSSVFPFSGGIMAASGTAATTLSAASAFAGPAVIIVGAVIGVVVSVVLLVEDNEFHDAMNRDRLTHYSKPFVQYIEDQRVDILKVMEKSKSLPENERTAGVELLLAFNDALDPQNSSKYLPVTISLPVKGSSAAGASTTVKRVTAALTRASGGATYLFYSDGSYARTSKNRSSGIDSGYPAALPGGWGGIATNWFNNIDAALPYQSTTQGYMWSGGDYLKLNDTRVQSGYPKNMPGGWKNMPSQWQGHVDAAIYYPANEKHYMFKGNEYIRLTGVTVDTGYPAKLPGGWRGMPSHFASGIDAATFRNNHTYMIKGPEYIRFTGTQIDSGYPKLMTVWPL